MWRKRNPDLSLRTAEPLTQGRGNVNEKMIRAWFREVGEYFNEMNLTTVFGQPERIFNCDETAIYLAPKGNKVLAKKGDKNVYQKSHNSEKENVTFLLNVSAAGEIAPPMIIYRYERILGDVARSMPNNWGIGLSESGWMNSATFFEYIANVFEPYLTSKKIKRPVVLFFDGHSSHLTLQLSEFCNLKKIELITLPPNATHIIQPLDRVVFKVLKSEYKNEVNI